MQITNKEYRNIDKKELKSSLHFKEMKKNLFCTVLTEKGKNCLPKNGPLQMKMKIQN